MIRRTCRCAVPRLSSTSLGVPSALVASHGAVSEAVATAMAQGALAAAPAQLALAVTGIAGPGGATPGKPVGLVWLAWGTQAALRTERFHFAGDRSSVRRLTVQMLTRAGWDARGMVELFALLRRESARDPHAVEQFFSSHPSPADRIAALEADVARRKGGRRDSAEFQSARARLRKMAPARAMPQ